MAIVSNYYGISQLLLHLTAEGVIHTPKITFLVGFSKFHEVDGDSFTSGRG